MKALTYTTQRLRTNTSGKIAKATRGRLPDYLAYLQRLPSHTTTISATMLARELQLGEVLVRKDLAAVSQQGKPKIGYAVAPLKKSMIVALGLNTMCEAVIVGAGQLGRALLSFGGFAEFGIQVACAFDVEMPQATDNALKPIYDIAQLPTYLATHAVEIGIITVPDEAAQAICDLLVKNGVQAIWNFASCRLQVPSGVIVQYENLALSLAHLQYQIQNKR